MVHSIKSGSHHLAVKASVPLTFQITFNPHSTHRPLYIVKHVFHSETETHRPWFHAVHWRERLSPRISHFPIQYVNYPLCARYSKERLDANRQFSCGHRQMEPSFVVKDVRSGRPANAPMIKHVTVTFKSVLRHEFLNTRLRHTTKSNAQFLSPHHLRVFLRYPLHVHIPSIYALPLQLLHHSVH